MLDPYRPMEAEIVERVQESHNVFTLRLRLTDPRMQAAYQFAPGQFNMVYLFGVGEVPISIVSDPEDDYLLDHTIRAVGRVSDGLSGLAAGARVGIRGPFGRGWPLAEAEGRDVLLATGGLGCAPVVSVINYIMRRRERFGTLTIMQGVKHSDDLIYRRHFERWHDVPNTRVLLAADRGGPMWPWHVGYITDLLDEVRPDPERTLSMMCGPEGMMLATIRSLLQHSLPEHLLFLSMERNMQCAIGHCGHCQYGGKFICKNGPVFPYSEVKQLLGKRGF
jgi:sulfhydrogenase subunit gamma (sulfur reductase)